jgi:hypothetical protein
MPMALRITLHFFDYSLETTRRVKAAHKIVLYTQDNLNIFPTNQMNKVSFHLWLKTGFLCSLKAQGST